MILIPAPKTLFSFLLPLFLTDFCFGSALLGLHEEVDYSEKLKFSDDEEEHSTGDRNKIWYELLLHCSLLPSLAVSFCHYIKGLWLNISFLGLSGRGTERTSGTANPP